VFSQKRWDSSEPLLFLKTLFFGLCFRMPMPDKDFYFLEEVATRWQVPLSEIHYHATHGQVQVMTWVNISVANIHRVIEAKNGTTVQITSRPTPYKGYAVIAPDELRSVLRDGTHSMRKFSSPTHNNIIEIHNECQDCKVSAHELVMARSERDRFEELYALMSTDKPDVDPSHAPMSFSGRPSSMHQVRQHFFERCEQGKLLPTLRQEASYLSKWAIENIKEGQPPKMKTIMNSVREDYRKYRITIPSVASQMEAPMA